MACQWIEGFETHTGTAQMQRKYAGWTGSISAQSGRVFGTSGSIISTVAVTPSFGTDNTFVVGFGVRLGSHLVGLNSNNQGLYIETGANEQCHIEQESTSGLGIRFHIKRGATIIATSSYFDFGVWHYIEVKLTVRTGTNGAYELRHNGVLDISGTLVNLADNGADGWDVFAIRYTSNANGILFYDDMYVLNGTGAKNNDFLGPSIVEGLLPNGVGTGGDNWTSSAAGANWTFVDDPATTPDDIGAGGYVGSDVNTTRDLYNFQDLTQITGVIHAVQLGSQFAMAAAGTRTVKTKYRDPDTTIVDGASHVVDATTYDEFTEVFDNNPNSTLAWDVNDISNGEFGIEVVS